MKFPIGQGGGQISLNQKISENKVSYIGLRYLIPDGRVQNPKFVFLTTPYIHQNSRILGDHSKDIME